MFNRYGFRIIWENPGVGGTLVLLIFQNIFHFNILFGLGFPTIPNLSNCY